MLAISSFLFKFVAKYSKKQEEEHARYKATVVRNVAGPAERGGPAAGHARVYGWADGPMALHTARNQHRRDDKPVESQPREAGRSIHHWLYAPHRLPTLERRHHKISLSHGYGQTR